MFTAVLVSEMVVAGVRPRRERAPRSAASAASAADVS